MQGKILKKVAFIRVVTGAKDSFAAEDFGVKVQIRLDFSFDVSPLRVKFIVFSVFGLC
jgi:hypothetical protein